MKTLDEEEDVASSTADLLEEGDELLGVVYEHHRSSLLILKPVQTRCVVVDCVSGEDSGSEGEEEEESSRPAEEEEEQLTCGNIRDEDKAEDRKQTCSAPDEPPAEDDQSAENEISFPDTNISLSHLQPNR